MVDLPAFIAAYEKYSLAIGTLLERPAILPPGAAFVNGKSAALWVMSCDTIRRSTAI
jgi:hypothetical protein